MIVITGASDGLGKEVAKLYQEAGKRVVNISRRESTYADINICLSLREGPQIKEAAQRILEIDEPIDALIHCIGTYNRQAFGEIEESEIKLLMSTNVKAPMLLTSLLIDRIKSDQADILNVVSFVAVKANGSTPLYTAAKWAERGFTKSLQVELRNTPCRVISFCPGGFDSDIHAKAKGTPTNKTNDQRMKTQDVAVLVKQMLDLPKNMEVLEIVFNHKH